MLKIHKPKISIIVPAFNEVRTVEQVIQKLSLLQIDKEIIVIDDFSTDGTRELLKKLQPQYRLKLILHAHNKGKGAGVVNGAAHAKGEYIIVQDADLELDPSDIMRMVDLMENQPALDLINGTRDFKTNKIPLISKIARFVTALTARLLYRQHIKDFLCGYKLCKLNKFKALQIQSHGFGLEVEWIVKAIKANWKIAQIPVSYEPRKKIDKKINLLDGFDIIWYLIKLRFSK